MFIFVAFNTRVHGRWLQLDIKGYWRADLLLRHNVHFCCGTKVRKMRDKNKHEKKELIQNTEWHMSFGLIQLTHNMCVSWVKGIEILGQVLLSRRF